MTEDSRESASKSQADKFREAAREAETDDREEAFDATLRRIAVAPPPPNEAAKPPKPPRR